MLHVETAGSGEPLVLVHGGWSDLHNWDAVVDRLAQEFLVVPYDRRGHGLSPALPGTRRDQEDDLAAIIAPYGDAHVLGTSFGASIALGLAARRPELVRSVIAHEPPLAALVPGLAEPVQAGIQGVLELVACGQHEAAARQFVEEVALGPGAWERLPAPLQATMTRSAVAFAAEQEDAAWASLDSPGAIECPVLLTQGDQSPPWFAPIVDALAQAIPGAERHTYPGAGHAPHISHPDDHVARVVPWLRGIAEPYGRAA